MDPVIALWSVVGLGGLLGLVKWGRNRFGSIPADTSTKPREIPASVKAELDQTPSWWWGEFHKALESSGETMMEPEKGAWEPEYITEMNYVGSICVTYQTTAPKWYAGCMCDPCHGNRLTYGAGH